MRIFNESYNVAVFTTRFVLRDGEVIQNVFHHEDDGVWEFTGATQAVEDNDYLIVSLQEIIDFDPSVQYLPELLMGKSAFRLSLDSPWEIR